MDIKNVPAGEITEIATTVSGLTIEMFRSNKWNGSREDLDGFVPAKVLKNGDTVWKFEKSDTVHFAELLEYGKEYVIVMRNKFVLVDVIRVSDFAHGVMITMGGRKIMMGGASTEELLDMKQAISMELNIDFQPTKEEIAILEARKAAQIKQLQESATAAAQAKEAARAERERFVASLLKRETVIAWSHKGQRYYGIPVYEDKEWQALPDGKYCILMKDDVPVEAFVVSKKNGTLKKDRLTVVQAEMPEKKVATTGTVATPEALDQIKVTLKGETRNVFMFSDMEAIRTLQKGGLNSGTWVCTPKDVATGRITVYAVTSKSINPVGQCVPKEDASA